MGIQPIKIMPMKSILDQFSKLSWVLKTLAISI